MKSSLLNISSCTVFKKHVSFLLDQNENNIKSSGLFYFLLCTLDRKEEILQWREHVHLHPIDLSIDDLIQTSSLTNINPVLLGSNQREKVLPGYYKIMKKKLQKFPLRISKSQYAIRMHSSLLVEKLILILSSCG